jgi:endonuclease/exonuclease/phosphatase family metal-dependent hydrolase
MWKRWIVRIAVVVIGLSIALIAFNGVVNFHASRMASASPTDEQHVLLGNTFTAVTFNTWRLCDLERVPAMLHALRDIGQSFYPESSTSILPDILLFQELECQAALDSLEEGLSDTHWFAANVCARKRSGESRSTVGVAVNRAKFEILGTIALDLGRIFPDHGRCALGVIMQSRQTGHTLQVVSVHHSPHPLKYRQTETLFRLFEDHDLLIADGIVLGGDFNLTTHAKSYRLVTSYLADPLPHDRGQTHWTGGRLDFLFINQHLTLLRPLDRKVAYEVLRPAGLFRSIYRCSDPEWTNCPISDHLPEGGLLAFSPSKILTSE